MMMMTAMTMVMVVAMMTMTMIRVRMVVLFARTGPRVPGHMVRPRLIFRWPGDFWQCHCRRRVACNPKRPSARWKTAVPRGLGPPYVPCTFPYVP